MALNSIWEPHYDKQYVIIPLLKSFIMLIDVLGKSVRVEFITKVNVQLETYVHNYQRKLRIFLLGQLSSIHHYVILYVQNLHFDGNTIRYYLQYIFSLFCIYLWEVHTR